MWACPECGRSFASRNQAHACAALGDLDHHFARASPQVRTTFDTVLAAVAVLSPVEVLAEKTRPEPGQPRPAVAGAVRRGLVATPWGAGT